MGVPLISLWTNSFKMPLRWYVGSFSERLLERQTNTIQQDIHRFVEITPGALLILSNVVGRRMTEPTRWILFDSLRDILNGNLLNQYPEGQDLLASTFGELLGVILLATRLGGEIEVVRLQESKKGKTPDFILLQNFPNGNKVAHILECKGRVEDVRNINALPMRSHYDLCHNLRSFRSEAIKQVDLVNLVKVKKGPSTTLKQKIPFSFSKLASTKNIAISSVPDGRITQKCIHSIFAPRSSCQPRGVTCVNCITNTTNKSQANVVCVLHQKDLGVGSTLNQGLVSFLTNYSSAQRALWSGNNSSFAETFNAAVEQLSNPDIRDVLPSVAFMLITLIETAMLEDFTQLDLNTQLLAALVPEQLRDILEDVVTELSVVNQLFEKQSRERSIPNSKDSINRRQPQFNGLDSASSGLGSEKWYINDLTLNEIINFVLLEEIIPPERAVISEDGVFGSIQSTESSSAIIRLASTNYWTLERFVNGLIARLRNGSEPDNWQSEYFEIISDDEKESGERFFVGKSWDQYPYPSTKYKRPGITAWIAEDGRAEIYVRRVEYLFHN